MQALFPEGFPFLQFIMNEYRKAQRLDISDGTCLVGKDKWRYNWNNQHSMSFYQKGIWFKIIDISQTKKIPRESEHKTIFNMLLSSCYPI